MHKRATWLSVLAGAAIVVSACTGGGGAATSAPAATPSPWKVGSHTDVGSIDDIEHGESRVVWFVAAPSATKKGAKAVTGLKKKTKNGKEYTQVFGVGPTGKPHRISVWGGKDLPVPFTLFCAEVNKDDYGASTTTWKMRKIA